MRRTVFVIVAVLLSTAFGQWLETTIPVGASLSYLCYNDSMNKVYCADSASNTVAVIDGATNQVVATVPVCTSPAALCYSPRNNKVYCANHGVYPDYDSTVTVIDGVADTAITTIRVGVGPLALRYNPLDNKVYCAVEDGVTVIDCVTDTVVTKVLAYFPGDLCYNSWSDKMYCLGWYNWNSEIAVIDCSTDTVIATFGGVGREMCYSDWWNKLYCSPGFGDSVVNVIDGNADTVIARVPVGGATVHCCNQTGDKVYCTRGNDVLIIDASADTVAAVVPVDRPMDVLFREPVCNKLYCAHTGSDPDYDSTVTVIDGATDSIICTIRVGEGPGAFCHNPVQNRVYVANTISGSVSVIRDSATGVAESRKPQAASCKPAATVIRSVLFLPGAVGGEPSAVGVRLLDISGRKVLDLQPGPNDVRHVAPGIYFVRSASGVERDASSVAKVVVTR